MNEEHITATPCRICGSQAECQGVDYVFAPLHGKRKLGFGQAMYVCPKCGLKTCADERDVLAYENRLLSEQVKLWNKEQEKVNKDVVRDIVTVLNEMLNGKTRSVRFTFEPNAHDPSAEFVFIKNVCRFVMRESNIKRIESFRYDGFSSFDREVVDEQYHVTYTICPFGVDWVEEERFYLGDFLDCDAIAILRNDDGSVDIFKNEEHIVKIELL